MAPAHFLGELAKTPEGCFYLREKGIVSELAEILRLHGMESQHQAVMTNVKSVLWAMVSLCSPEECSVTGLINSTIGSYWLLRRRSCVS